MRAEIRPSPLTRLRFARGRQEPHAPDRCSGVREGPDRAPDHRDPVDGRGGLTGKRRIGRRRPVRRRVGTAAVRPRRGAARLPRPTAVRPRRQRPRQGAPGLRQFDGAEPLRAARPLHRVGDRRRGRRGAGCRRRQPDRTITRRCRALPGRDPARPRRRPRGARQVAGREVGRTGCRGQRRRPAVRPEARRTVGPHGCQRD